MGILLYRFHHLFFHVSDQKMDAETNGKTHAISGGTKEKQRLTPASIHHVSIP